MADDLVTFQIGGNTDLVQALVDINNTTGIVSADVSLLNGLVKVPVTVTTATLGAGGSVSIAGRTLLGETVGISFVENQATAAIQTNIGGLITTTTEAAVAVCFCSGTAIRTTRGDVPVEMLAVGDVAIVASGEHRAVRWLGHRTVDCRRHPRPHEIMPVRIAAGAFGPDRPVRDLRVSPGHALCVDILGEVLIPAASLINGATIIQEDVDTVVYWHVELDHHDILLAENMPAESYLEMGNRGFFTEADVIDLAACPDALVRTHADFCRPFHAGGSYVEVARAHLASRAHQLGWRPAAAEQLGDLHLVVDGRRVDPVIRGLQARFTLPASTRDVWLVSTVTVPKELGLNPDARCLGAFLGQLVLHDAFSEPRVIDAATDERLVLGFHAAEPNGRWTGSRAHLPAELWAGMEDEIFLRVDLAGLPLPRWAAPSAERIEVRSEAA